MKKRTVPTPGRVHRWSVGAFTPVLALALLVAFPLRGQQASGQSEPRKIAQAVNGYVSEDALQILFSRNTDVGEFGTNVARLGFLFNESNDLVAEGDMLVSVGQNRHPRWSLELGPRGYAGLLSVDNGDIFAIALGGALSYNLGRERNTTVSVAAFYAPDITTFGNANSVADTDFNISAHVTEAARVYFGYRWLRFDLEAQPGVTGGDRDIDEGFHVGVIYEF
jgi:hypothetical protein